MSRRSWMEDITLHSHFNFCKIRHILFVNGQRNDIKLLFTQAKEITLNSIEWETDWCYNRPLIFVWSMTLCWFVRQQMCKMVRTLQMFSITSSSMQGNWKLGQKCSKRSLLSIISTLEQNLLLNFPKKSSIIINHISSNIMSMYCRNSIREC
jgi:hypothetical protein